MTPLKKKILFCASFLAPALILYTVFAIYPILNTSYLSFMEWDGFSAKTFVGLQNYISLWNNSKFWLTLKNTMTLVFSSLALQVTLGVVIAYLLFNTVHMMKIYRAFYFLPVVIASTAVATMFRILLNSDLGVVNGVLSFFGAGPLRKALLSSRSSALWCVVGVQIWQHIGTYVIIFLAAFQSLDESVFESAMIDGANKLQTFLRIACPMVKEIFCIALVFCFTGSMKAFDIAYVMTAGGPGYYSSYLSHLMFKMTFYSDKDFGTGSAIGVIVLLISFAATVVIKTIFNEKMPRMAKGGKA